MFPKPYRPRRYGFLFGDCLTHGTMNLGDQTYTIAGERLWQWRNEQLQRFSRRSPQSSVEIGNLANELDWLIREVTPLDRLALRLEFYKNQDIVGSRLSMSALEELWQKRVQSQMPLQYLLGYCNWRHFQLLVSPDVLIPRPETEDLIEIVERATEDYPALKQGEWVDLGTGSGAIALGLSELMPDATIYAVDLSPEALAIAQKNAERYGMGHRIQFWQGSWFDPLPHAPGQLSGVCSNPPYIPTEVISTLQPEVQNHEPHLALDGGVDGLRDIRHLIAHAQDYLCPWGFLIMECMAGQGNAIAQLMANQNYAEIQIHPDLAGHDRFVSGRKQSD